MYRIQVILQVIDEKTGEVAKSKHGSHPVEWKNQYYPLFDKVDDAHACLNGLEKVTTEAMHMGMQFYRSGVSEKT